MWSLIRKNIVNSEQEEINYEYEIKDFCCTEDDIYFLHNNGLAKVSGGEINLNFLDEVCFNEKFDPEKFSSICYNKQGDIFICSEGGVLIHKLDINLYTLYKLIYDEKTIYKKHINQKGSKTYITANNNCVFWSIKNCHRILSLSEYGVLSPCIGSGRSGFSLSNDLKKCKISMPTGLSTIGETLVFADSGNNCLRAAEGQSCFVLANNLKDLKSVSISNNKIFFLSENTIKMFFSEGESGHVFEVFNCKKEIISFCANDNNNLTIMVKE